MILPAPSILSATEIFMKPNAFAATGLVTGCGQNDQAKINEIECDRHHIDVDAKQTHHQLLEYTIKF